MAKTKKDNQNMEFPLQIARQYPAPLDKYSLFYSLSDAEDYAINSPLAYVGQLLSVVNETDKTVDIYKINADGTLGGLADAKHIDNTFVKKSGDTMTGTLTIKDGNQSYNARGYYNNTPTIQYNSLFKSGFYGSSWAEYDKCIVCGEGNDKAVIQFDYNDGWHMRASNGGNEFLNARWMDTEGGIYDKGQRVYSPNNPPPLYQHNIKLTNADNNCRVLFSLFTTDSFAYTSVENDLRRVMTTFNIPVSGNCSIVTDQPYYGIVASISAGSSNSIRVNCVTNNNSVPAYSMADKYGTIITDDVVKLM